MAEVRKPREEKEPIGPGRRDDQESGQPVQLEPERESESRPGEPGGGGPTQPGHGGGVPVK